MKEYEQLPLFPLGVVLCPGERKSLHIFEDRYQQMIRYCLETDEPFGLVLAREGGIAEIGCLAQIEKVLNKYEDGRLDILVRGDRRFRIRKMFQERAYLTASVEILPEQLREIDPRLRERAITQHMKLLEMIGQTIRPHIYQNVPFVSYVLTRDSGLDLEQKQKFLELPTEGDRISYLVDYFETVLPQIEEAEEARARIRSNGHFKHLPPEEGPENS